MRRSSGEAGDRLVVAPLCRWRSRSRRAPAPTLEILEPKDGAYVSGDVLVEAEVRPSGQSVERVLFFVDGRLVCTVEAPPFECEWNVGGDGRPHDFRVVAVLPGGRRIPRTVRTRGVDYVDTGGAEMVLVTATVLDGDRLVQGLPERGVPRVRRRQAAADRSTSFPRTSRSSSWWPSTSATAWSTRSTA